MGSNQQIIVEYTNGFGAEREGEEEEKEGGKEGLRKGRRKIDF